jgi:hypothetical protein
MYDPFVDNEVAEVPEELEASIRLPVYSQEQTFEQTSWTSKKCHKPT